MVISYSNPWFFILFPYLKASGDSMIFRISWAADPCRSETMWTRSRTVPNSEIKCQKSGDSMCGEFRPKLVFTSNFESIYFRLTWTRQTFDILFHNKRPSFIENTWSLAGRGRRPMKPQFIESNSSYSYKNIVNRIWTVYGIRVT